VKARHCTGFCSQDRWALARVVGARPVGRGKLAEDICAL
jgi:hypothetical protein